MSGGGRPPGAAPAAGEGFGYRIDDLARLSGATARTIRGYQDRGLLPRPERRGRSNLYGAVHLDRLGRIADLLDRGYTLASIKELLDAWDEGRGLGGVLGLAAEVAGPWSEEEEGRVTRAELAEAFGAGSHGALIAQALRLGVLERIPGEPDAFRVPSPQELSVAVELHAAGVPLTAIAVQLAEVRELVEHLAARLLEFTTEHVFGRFLADGPPTDEQATEAAGLVRRLRPLARRTVDAELARAMRMLATRDLPRHLAGETAAGPGSGPPASRAVALPAETVAAVERAVGSQGAAEFIAASAERELRARVLDALLPPAGGTGAVDQHPLSTDDVGQSGAKQRAVVHRQPKNSVDKSN
ncbi:MerR family transcriptional regulator [Streptomyces sp. C10-9-1]|uniref:MerR family transcriptional regulator n=1 Tax=Streptomyces sp. C10-9-1 TaxID=1859285 RepID=UPI003F4A122D